MARPSTSASDIPNHFASSSRSIQREGSSVNDLRRAGLRPSDIFTRYGSGPVSACLTFNLCGMVFFAARAFFWISFSNSAMRERHRAISFFLRSASFSTSRIIPNSRWISAESPSIFFVTVTDLMAAAWRARNAFWRSAFDGAFSFLGRPLAHFFFTVNGNGITFASVGKSTMVSGIFWYFALR